MAAADGEYGLLVEFAPQLLGLDRLEVVVIPSLAVEVLVNTVAVSAGLPSSIVRICFRGKVLRDIGCSLADVGIGPEHFVVAHTMHQLEWMPASDGEVPPEAVHAGHMADGTSLYLARASIGGGMHLGMLCPELGGARFGYGGT